MKPCILWNPVICISCLVLVPAMIHSQQIRSHPWKGEEIEYVGGRIDIKLRVGFNSEAIIEVVSRHGGKIVADFDDLGWGLAQLPEETDIFTVIEELLRDEAVDVAEPVMVTHVAYDPNDPYYSGAPPLTYAYQWALWNFGQQPPGGTPGADINVRKAWDITLGSPDVLVAVLDTGIPLDIETYQLCHPDLEDPQRIIIGPDFIHRDQPGGLPEEDNPTIRDSLGHGTHVAGILAAETDNGEGIAGVAGHCRVLAIQVFAWTGAGTVRALYDGILYAVNHGAMVINYSGTQPFPSKLLEDAIQFAHDNSVLLVAAAGNTACQDLLYPARYSTMFDNVIAVGSTDKNDDHSVFSACGPELNVVAPGGSHLELEGERVFSTLPNYYHQGYPRFYGYGAGTSMAAPHIAGVSALMLSVNPSLVPETLRDILQKTADDKGSPGWDSEYGWGRVNAYQATLLALAYRNSSIASSATEFNSARHLTKAENSLHEVFSSGGEVFHRRSRDGGVTWDVTQRITLGDGNSSADCITSTQGYLHVVWQRQIGPTTYEIWHTRSIDDGVNWGKPALLNEATVSEHQTNGAMPVIEYGMEDVGGLLVVVYCSSNGLHYRVSEDNGELWTDDERITSQYDDRVESPSLAASGAHFSLMYDCTEDDNSPYSRFFNGSSWSDETSAGKETGAVLGASPSVAIDTDNNPIGAWSSVANSWTRSIIFRAGYSDNTWSSWFVEFGQGQIGPDWLHPSLTYYNREGNGQYGVAIVNHTSLNSVKLVRLSSIADPPSWDIATLSESGAWANITHDSYSSGNPIYCWTNQSASPYEIVVGSSDGLRKVNLLAYNHKRRAVVYHRAQNTTLAVEFEPMRIVTAGRDTIEVPFKQSLLRQRTFDLATMWDYLGSDTVRLPSTARWLILKKQFSSRGPATFQRRYYFRLLDSNGVPITVLDTTAFTNTVAVNIAAYAGRGVILRPQVALAGISPASVSTAVGDIFMEPAEQASPMLANRETQGLTNLPQEFILAQNYPNPCNPTTTVRYGLPVASTVSLRLYDVLGREVMRLVDGQVSAGYHQVTVDASTLASGVYLYRIDAGSFTQVKKLLLLK